MSTTHRRAARTTARTTSRKVVVSLGVVGVAAAVAGMGTFGTFTSSTTASETVNSGTVKIELGAAGPANRLSLTAANIVPTDTISRAVTLSNTGDQALAGLVLNTTATAPASLLTTDPVNGLQMTILACSSAWTESGTSPAFSYVCPAGSTQTTILAQRPAVGANTTLAASPALAPGGTANLVVQLTLPSTADNTFQKLTSTIGLEFVGTQRAGTAR